MGSTSYPDRKMTLKQLRKELPFPTKMVTVSLPGSVIQDALSFSRTNITEKDAKTALGPTIERRGYLQMDGEVEIDEENNHRIISVGGKPFDPSHVYSVALPRCPSSPPPIESHEVSIVRNLLAGFCEIKPLMEWAESHKDQMPEKEAFIPAFNLVLSFFMKERYGRRVSLIYITEFPHVGGGSFTFPSKKSIQITRVQLTRRSLWLLSSAGLSFLSFHRLA